MPSFPHYSHLSANENFTFETEFYNHTVLVILNFLQQLLSAKIFVLCNQYSKDKYHIWNEEKKNQGLFTWEIHSRVKGECKKPNGNHVYENI